MSLDKTWQQIGHYSVVCQTLHKVQFKLSNLSKFTAHCNFKIPLPCILQKKFVFFGNLICEL